MSFIKDKILDLSRLEGVFQANIEKKKKTFIFAV